MKHEEHNIQKACIAAFKSFFPNDTGSLFAIPNGGYRTSREGARLRAEGVLAGASDLVYTKKDSSGSILFIEMKTPKGRQQDSQKAFQQYQESNGHKYIICRSVADFIQAIQHHKTS